MNVHDLDLSLETRVQRGVLFLDVRMPGWWRIEQARAIDLTRFDMSDYNFCVFGQVYPSYFEGTEDLCLHAAEVNPALQGFDAGDLIELHGIDLMGCDHDRPSGATLDRLTELWAKVITERQLDALGL